MRVNPMDILVQFPIRKTKKQAFRAALQAYAENLGYRVSTEESGNLVMGDPMQAKYVLSSSDVASGVITWLEILRTFPENQRHRVCFVWFDGKSGMKSFRKQHKPATDRQLLIHLGHVGDGNHLRYYPTKQLKLDRLRLTSLYRACGYFGTRDLLVEEKKKPMNVTVWGSFPYGVTICALQDHKKGMRYRGRTKTNALEETNVNILRAALTTFLCCDEVNEKGK